jgi:hypothetical protein
MKAFEYDHPTASKNIDTSQYQADNPGTAQENMIYINNK